MDYLEISGYKSIKSVRIDFKPINILIGANGSGKTISFLFLIFSIDYIIENLMII